VRAPLCRGAGRARRGTAGRAAAGAPRPCARLLPAAERSKRVLVGHFCRVGRALSRGGCGCFGAEALGFTPWRQGVRRGAAGSVCGLVRAGMAAAAMGVSPVLGEPDLLRTRGWAVVLLRHPACHCVPSAGPWCGGCRRALAHPTASCGACKRRLRRSVRLSGGRWH